MKNRLEGIVIEVKDQIARVKIRRHGDCSNCGSCPGDEAVLVDAFNDAEAQPGRRVIVEMDGDRMLMSVFVVFVLPLAAIAAGCFIGLGLARMVNQFEILLEITGGLICFLLSVGYIKHFDRMIKAKQNLATIIQIAN